MSGPLIPTDNQTYIDIPYLDVAVNESVVLLSSIVLVSTLLLILVPWGVYFLVGKMRPKKQNDQNDTTRVGKPVEPPPSPVPQQNITRINVEVPPSSRETRDDTPHDDRLNQ